MKKTAYYLFGIALIFTASCFFDHAAFAGGDDEDAYEYFQEGEKYFRNGQYDDALFAYEKAIGERDEDGRISLEDKSRIKEQKFVPYGRTVKKVVVYETIEADYIPNKRIAEIRRIQERRQQYATPAPAPAPVTAPYTPYAPASASIAASELANNIPFTNLQNRDAIAVVIGNRDYQSKDIPSVDFALNDADIMKRYLINVLGYQEGNIIYEQNASKGKFESIFGVRDNHRGRLFNYLKKGKSDIFIYYSGHGAPDSHSKEGYFVPADADPQAIGLTGYSLKLLYDNIAGLATDLKPPNVFIVIEACFSGATEKGLLLKNVSPISIEVSTPLLAMRNAVVLTSSSGSEVSSWYPEKGHSMFTYLFLSALRDAAIGGKGTVTAGKIFKTVSDETEGLPYYARRMYGRIQTPQIMGDAARPLLAFPQH